MRRYQMAEAERPSASRPRPLLWLYTLIAVGLVSVGVAAGNIAFFGLRSLALPYALEHVRCEREFGRIGDGLEVDGFLACMSGAARLRGLTMVAGAVIVVLGAALLAFAVPLLDRRRLRRHTGRDHPAARERFAELCRHHGLAGRAAPRLVVGGPTLRHAFTTAVPGRRPTVVVPARLAITQGAEFDAVVSHEIAHVLARDVTWVSVLRGPLWLFLPVILLASLPEFEAAGFTVVPVTTAIEAALLVAAVAVLAAALLRLRELEADRYAARTGSQSALRAMFERSSAHRRPPTARGRLALLFAKHPTPVARATALQEPDRSFEGGFAQTLAVGFVAMMAMGTVASVLGALNMRWYTWQGSVLAAAAGAGVLALVIPSLFRRAHHHTDQHQWWRPVVGVVSGIVLGAFVSPVVSIPGEIPFPPLPAGGIASRVAAVALVALLGAGVVASTIGLAVLATDAGRLRTRLSMVAAALTGVAALWPVASVMSLVEQPGTLRFWFGYVLAQQPWPLVGLSLPLACGMLLAGRVNGLRRLWLVTVSATVAGAGAAILATTAAAATSVDDLLRVQQQRWWICFSAGVVVLGVLSLRRGGRAVWPHALMAATSATLVAGVAQYLHAVIDGRSSDLMAARAHIGTAVIWLFYVAVLSAPLLLVLRPPLARPEALSASTSPGAATAGGMAAPASGPASAAVAAAAAILAVGVLAVGVLAIGIPGGLATLPAPPAHNPSTSPAPAPTATVDGAPTAPPRMLTAAQAQAVADAGKRVLPGYWRTRTPPPVSSEGAVISPSTCRPLAKDEFLQVGLPHLRGTARASFETEESAVGLSSSELSIDVYSYDQPMAAHVINAAEADRARCPAFKGTSGGGTVDFVVHAAQAPAIGEQAWRYDASMSAGSGGGRVTGRYAAVIVGVGNTVIVAYLSAVMEPLDEKLLAQVLQASVETLLTLP